MFNSNSYMYNYKDFFEKNRIIFLYGPINTQMCYDVCFQLKYLNYIDQNKEITIEINSPGGDVNAGLAIIDTMLCISNPIKIVICGLAASMAAVIASAGTKGLRFALPHSSIMIHQPKGGFDVSQATDIEIYAKNIVKVKKLLNELLAKFTSKKLNEIETDTERDYFLSPFEALEYGIIDQVIEERRRDENNS